ncbi:helix-turn-helix transcriptional regulator [uncultured Polaribacter sp.]|uniref:helix-turn-helix domain-containing protein n=1 Tax=uncultured Polaribacter sp. TaxID=174711 RepID=UPI00259AF4DE|nr:helix-turn-helix transcriptional regulator [uncultured Polaribacter sp.]
MLPKYSFKLKPTKRSLPKEKPFTHTLGEYIRFERVKRHIKQETLAKQFGVNGVALSSWELNRKQIHPKQFNKIINFLGYVPQKQSEFDSLGIRTQLWRLQNNISITEFSEIINIPKKEIIKIEQARYYKSKKDLEEKIKLFLIK